MALPKQFSRVDSILKRYNFSIRNFWLLFSLGASVVAMLRLKCRTKLNAQHRTRARALYTFGSQLRHATRLYRIVSVSHQHFTQDRTLPPEKWKLLHTLFRPLHRLPRLSLTSFLDFLRAGVGKLFSFGNCCRVARAAKCAR